MKGSSYGTVAERGRAPNYFWCNNTPYKVSLDFQVESEYSAQMWKENEFTTDATGTEPPYLIKRIVTEERSFNPKYGLDRVCNCGHPYYRHFDSYTNDFDSVGCKYCPCYVFEEAKDASSGNDRHL